MRPGRTPDFPRYGTGAWRWLRRCPAFSTAPDYCGSMLAAYAVSQSSTDPLSGLVIDQRPDPVARPWWSVVKLRAAGPPLYAAGSLRGVGLSAACLPPTLG